MEAAASADEIGLTAATAALLDPMYVGEPLGDGYLLAAVPGVIGARRYLAGGPEIENKYLALYHMTSPAVSRSPEWAKAANTPWTERMRPHFQKPMVIRLNKYKRAS